MYECEYTIGERVMFVAAAVLGDNVAFSVPLAHRLSNIYTSRYLEITNSPTIKPGLTFNCTGGTRQD